MQLNLRPLTTRISDVRHMCAPLHRASQAVRYGRSNSGSPWIPPPHRSQPPSTCASTRRRTAGRGTTASSPRQARCLSGGGRGGGGGGGGVRGCLGSCGGGQRLLWGGIVPFPGITQQMVDAAPPPEE